eukprot:COSAG03_NODE_6327_length_1078_cov_1.002043_1_plen_56_part_00
MWYAVISADGELLGLYTSRIDGCLASKPHIGSTVWACKPNAAGGERIATCNAVVR